MNCIFKVLFIVFSVTVVGLSSHYIEAGGEKKAPAPSKQKIAQSRKLIFDIFGDDIKNADTPTANAKLASTLLQQGKECDPKSSDRYVCFNEAIALASKSGDPSLAILTVDTLAKEYEVDGLELKMNALESVGKSIEGKDNNRAFVEMLLPMMQQAVDDDNYDVAFRFSKLALDAAKKAKSIALVKNVQKRDKDARAVYKGFARLKPFIETLKTNSNDPKANFEMGSYFGLLKGNWKKALPYFAKGSDADLSKLAKEDLGSPNETPGRLQLADGWWNFSKTQKDPALLNLQKRAMFWYDKALIDLRGLNRTKALKRIDAVTARLSDSPTPGPIGKIGKLHIFTGHTKEVKSVAISSNNRYVASASDDETVRVWDIGAGKLVKTLTGHSNLVWGVAFHPNNQRVASASWDATARLWDFKSGKEVKRYPHPIDINGISFSRDGSQLLVGCDNKTMYRWDTNSKKQLGTYSGHSDYVYGVAFSPTGAHVASGSNDRTAQIHERTSGKKLHVLIHNNAVYNVVFSPDGRHLFTSGDEAAKMWEVASGMLIKQFHGHQGLVLGLALSANGRRLLTGGDDKTVRLWDVSTGKELKKFTGHEDSISAVAISANGRIGVSAGRDNTVRVWGLPIR